MQNKYLEKLAGARLTKAVDGVISFGENVLGTRARKAKSFANTLAEASSRGLTPASAYKAADAAELARNAARLKLGVGVAGLSGAAYVGAKSYQKRKERAILNDIDAMFPASTGYTASPEAVAQAAQSY
jgi:hypothetical protein